jgi:hypothetical protein
VNSNIASTNSKLESFEANVMGEFATIKGELASLAIAFNQWLKQFHGSLSSKKPSQYESRDSSHNMAFQSNSLHHDPHLPRVEVNKFDGLDPIGWVTQMEHYFSLHGITNDLSKIHYGVLCMDPECWKWWQSSRKTCQGYVVWTQFVVEIFECFDTDTYYLVYLTKLKQFDIVDDFILAFEHLHF